MLEIQVKGVPFTRWETGSVTRSIDSASGTFQFATSELSPSDFPVKEGDFVEVLVDKESKIFGYVDEINASGDNKSHTIKIQGRDNIQDLIDSTVPQEAKTVQGPITLSALCERVITGLGTLSLSVFDQTGQPNLFSADELQAAETGKKALEYIQDYASNKNVFIIPDGRGNMILFKPGLLTATSPLLHQKNGRNNNIKSWSVRKSLSKRYYAYLCYSQANVGSNNFADYSALGMTRRGQSLDTDVRNSRFFELPSEEEMTNAECIKRANEENNIRRARAIEYTCTVAGFSQAKGKVWDIGQKVIVKDDFADISGQFLIRSVTYNSDLGSGTETTIVCAPIDAYTVQAIPSPSDSRKSNTGTKFSKEVPEVNKRINRGV